MNEIDALNEYHLKVFKNRSELQLEDGSVTVFTEGSMSIAARDRYGKIKGTLKNGFLTNQIELCRMSPHDLDWSSLTVNHEEALRNLIESVTSEVGRAIVGLTLLQLVIKAIEPNQSIRLHKGSQAAASGFGWIEGVSMRRLDAEYITPTLRRERLLNLNADGIMMTRSLAENYPYSKVYKSAIRGARNEWLKIVDWLENGTISPLPALQFVVSQLINRAAAFQETANLVLSVVEKEINDGSFDSIVKVERIIFRHISASDYKARIFEIAIHSLMQILEEVEALGDSRLVPISQMRSANKKHGNVGDVELVESELIVEAWDGKFGKEYLRDELEELNDKLKSHPSIRLAGFICSGKPDLSREISERVSELEEVYDSKILLLTFSEWVIFQKSRAEEAMVHEKVLAEGWIRAYAESLSQKRRELAPIDEPCQQWLESLKLTLGA